MKIWDCAVVGAGPAGSASALLLARAGLSVVLLDKARFPRPKACGEGILPSGVAALAALGLSAEAAALGRPFSGIAYTARSGARAEGRFSSGPGLAVPREALDDALVRAATKAGARLSDGALLESLEPAPEGWRLSAGGEMLSCRVLVAADGLSSPCLRFMDVPRVRASRRRFGLSARLANASGVGELVEIRLLERGELYLTPLPGGLVNAAALLDAPVGENALRELLGGRAELVTPVRGLGPLGGRAGVWEGETWLAAGDAAGAVDPLIGDGVGLALRAAPLVAEAVRRKLERRDTPGAYSSSLRLLRRRQELMAAGLLALTRRPLAAEAAVAILRRSPSLFAALLN